MLRRVLRSFRNALGRREPPAEVQNPSDAIAIERMQLHHDFFRRYVRCRFGPNEAISEAVMRQYREWLLASGEFRIHMVSADGRGVLLPMRVLDALAAGLGIMPVTLESPLWAVEEEHDHRFPRAHEVDSVKLFECGRMRELAAQYQEDATAPRAT